MLLPDSLVVSTARRSPVKQLLPVLETRCLMHSSAHQSEAISSKLVVLMMLHDDAGGSIRGQGRIGKMLLHRAVCNRNKQGECTVRCHDL
jgi:hypothetical protein